ncbi:MAG: TIGR01777 family oxidoreductase, partial [Planctomycetes bacterium]|nr:TIGR01777 family oxidoreductase [Planctomycetota bacterium]
EAADPRPRTFVCASAIGIYGERGDEVLTERSSTGVGFLADVASEWEAAARPLEALGVRVVHLRIGIVLSRHGGALAKMLLPFRLGVGGVIGDGKQWMSWISRADLVRVIQRAVSDDTMSGAYNAVAPGAVTNASFTRALGHALRRPTIFPLPTFVARLVFGREFADALLLGSMRVQPERLQDLGFEFLHADIAAGLSAALTENGG